MRLLAVVLAGAALTGALAAAPAAHARTDDLSKPVLLVIGPERASGSCAPFDDFSAKLAEYSTTAGGRKVGPVEQIDTLGRASDCSHAVGAAADTIEQAGDKLAAYIADQYKDKPVDIVAEGGAGLVVRYALQRRPQLKVEDVVTIGTPHGGSTALADACGGRPLCAEVRPGSALLRDLARNPQGAGGTDWSAIGSDADAVVGADSAIGMDAEHRTLFVEATREDLLHDTSSGNDARLRHSHGGASWINWNKAPHPVVRAIKDLVFGAGDADRTCGLQQTNPDACWLTPVILVPGFGASELSCTEAGKTIDLWPGALTDKDLFDDLALSSDGRGSWSGSECGRSSSPTGHVLKQVLGIKNIHGSSWEWLTRIAPGRAYEFGWDYRKGPDQALALLDRYIDEVRARHGVSRVAIVSHSYGGLLARWYLDDPEHAKKVARVANFGSPWWGAPKAWFAMAYGYESPGFSPTDLLVSGPQFKLFARNLMGMYYLFPADAWFKHAPEPLRNWLEVDEVPQRTPAQVADAARAFGGNGGLVAEAAKAHVEHIDGFKRTNGVDFRTFIGSGLPTLGHVRAYTGTTEVQYSWINGDGTVPLFSQRQSARPGDPQLGDAVKTYNFCGIKHMGEMEDSALQQAVTPFVRNGEEPSAQNGALRTAPCPLKASQFSVTAREDARSIAISTDGEAAASRVRARASSAPMTLEQAEAAGLVDMIHEPSRTVFVTNTRAPITVHVAGTGSLQVTPLTGDGRTGAARVYDLDAAGVDVKVAGAQSAAYAGGRAIAGRAADTTPPRTTVRRRGGRLVATAKDASGVAVTMVQVGRHRAKPWKRPLKAARGTVVRYWSVDVFGNAERKRRMR